MTDQPRIVAFAGSARRNSFNLKLVKVAAEGAQAAGADVTVLDMRDFPMPLFDQDLEAAEGSPENARKLRKIILAHDGLLIASPEYNSSITPLLKNAIDWVSRAGEGEKALAAYEGKVGAVMSASPGRAACADWFTCGRSSRTLGCWSYPIRLPWARPIPRLMKTEPWLTKDGGHRSRAWAKA